MTTWVSPPTWTNESLTASAMNSRTRDQLLWLKELLTDGTDSVNSTLRIKRPTAADAAYQARLAADTQPRWQAEVGGRHLWGSGAATGDVSLERRAAGELVMGSSTGTYRLNLQAASSDLVFRDDGGALRHFLAYTAADDDLTFYRATGSAGSETQFEMARFHAADAAGWSASAAAGLMSFTRAGGTNPILAAYITGGAAPRWKLEAGGTMTWLNGNNLAGNVSLGQSADKFLDLNSGNLRPQGGAAILIPVKAGNFADSDFLNPVDGIIGWNSSALQFEVRSGGLWHAT